MRLMHTPAPRLNLRNAFISSAFGTVLMTTACDRVAPAPTPPIAPTSVTTGESVPPVAVVKTEPAATETPVVAANDEVKIMSEKWENGKLKYWNEMRRDEKGKWQKNGLGRAFYFEGQMEREGSYKNGKRVGKWRYFDAQGKEIGGEDRGPNGEIPGTR